MILPGWRADIKHDSLCTREITSTMQAIKTVRYTLLEKFKLAVFFKIWHSFTRRGWSWNLEKAKRVRLHDKNSPDNAYRKLHRNRITLQLTNGLSSSSSFHVTIIIAALQPQLSAVEN